MTKEVFIEKMKQHESEIDKIWMKIVEDTNKFIKQNPEVSMYSFQNNIENFSDDLCLKGAWIQDRINGKMPKDRGSLTKKIKKALGFIYY